MLILPIALLAALLIVVAVARSRKKQGTMTEASYRTLVSASAAVVTVGALIVLFMRMRG